MSNPNFTRNLNLGTGLEGTATLAAGTVLNGAFTGGVDTAVLRWENVVVPAGGRITFVTSVANGTVLTLLDAGAYAIDMSLALTGNVALDVGFGQNMAAAPIVGDPSVGTDGVFKANSVLGVAALRMGVELGTIFYAAAGDTVRLLATDPFSGAPSALATASANFRLVKIGNFSSP